MTYPEDLRLRTLSVVRRGVQSLYTYWDARDLAVREFGEPAVDEAEAFPLTGDARGECVWRVLWDVLRLTDAVAAHEARVVWIDPITGHAA